MQKLSIWTAFIVVCVSLGISKYLSTVKQTFLLTPEAPIELITSPSSKQPPKQTSTANQTSLLTPETPIELITSPSLKHPPKQTSTANQTSLLTPETPIELITSPSSKQPPKAISILEQEVFEQVNEYRVSRHLPPLTLDSRISEQARIYSQAMASGKVPFGQEGLELHTEAISNVISYQGIAENVVYNLGYSDPVRAAVGSWLRNPERGLVSIEGQYELTGIGVATNIKGEYYFTQIFVHR